MRKIVIVRNDSACPGAEMSIPAGAVLEIVKVTEDSVILKVRE